LKKIETQTLNLRKILIMKRTMLLFALLMGSSSFAQNVTGNWQGIMTHPNDTAGFTENYAFWLNIEQEGIDISGQSRVEMGNSKNFSLLNFEGTFKSNLLTITEISWEESYMQDDMFINWCQKIMNLVYTWEDSTESLRGIWHSTEEDCGPGEIYVHRSVTEFNLRTAHSTNYVSFVEFKSRIKEGESIDGLKVILPEVTFEAFEANLIPEARPILRELKELMIEFPKLRIDILGHTGNLGGDQYNLTLSHARAKMVKDYLEKMGIPESRLHYHGFGESRPIASNETEDGRRENRRIEFEVINH
jgi:outer membrane protein OmpA-like peptidoglycan-associated protein